MPRSESLSEMQKLAHALEDRIKACVSCNDYNLDKNENGRAIKRIRDEAAEFKKTFIRIDNDFGQIRRLLS